MVAGFYRPHHLQSGLKEKNQPVRMLHWTELQGQAKESWNWVYLHRFHKLLQEETEHVQLRTPPPPPVKGKQPDVTTGTVRASF